MKILFLSLFIIVFASTSFSQSKTEKKIISILKTQDESWNKGDIDGDLIDILAKKTKLKISEI